VTAQTTSRIPTSSASSDHPGCGGADRLAGTRRDNLPTGIHALAISDAPTVATASRRWLRNHSVLDDRVGRPN
jgi:hypothetical protein